MTKTPRTRKPLTVRYLATKTFVQVFVASLATYIVVVLANLHGGANFDWVVG